MKTKNSISQSAKKPSREINRAFNSRVAEIAKLTAVLAQAVADLKLADLPTPSETADFYDLVRRFEVSLIERALRQSGGSQVKAARLLNLQKTTLNSKIRSYNIQVADVLRRNLPSEPLQSKL